MTQRYPLFQSELLGTEEVAAGPPILPIPLPLFCCPGVPPRTPPLDCSSRPESGSLPLTVALVTLADPRGSLPRPDTSSRGCWLLASCAGASEGLLRRPSGPSCMPDSRSIGLLRRSSECPDVLGGGSANGFSSGEMGWLMTVARWLVSESGGRPTMSLQSENTAVATLCTVQHSVLCPGVIACRPI